MNSSFVEQNVFLQNTQILPTAGSTVQLANITSHSSLRIFTHFNKLGKGNILKNI